MRLNTAFSVISSRCAHAALASDQVTGLGVDKQVRCQVMEMLLIMVVFIGLMYVMMVLPQRKKMEAQKKLLASLEPGTRVMLNTGMFGTIRATGQAQMVVELAPGVEVTVLKQAVVRQLLPDEEEFDYTDGDQTPADAFVSESAATVVPEQQWQVDENAAEAFEQPSAEEFFSEPEAADVANPDETIDPDADQRPQTH